jgi:tRNA (cytidine/uridine-2'-O-)-methyltransferase
MADLNIALIEPEIPQNTGNIARTCAATGAALHLVRPFGFEINDRHLKRAGLDYWDKLDITYYDSLEEFLEKTKDAPHFFFTTKAPRRHTDVTFPKGTFLVMGKETAGLPEWLLEKEQKNCLRIPMRESLRSLNLSNAAAIAVYETLRQWDFEGLESAGEARTFVWNKE